MAEHVHQISSWSFQYECSRVKLNILKLYVHLLGVWWNLFSSLFFFHWVFTTCWSKDTRLISDKTRINYCSFSRGQVFYLGIRLTRPPYLGVWVHSKDKLFSFLCVLCTGLFWNLGFFRISNYVLGFSKNRGNFLCVFILWQVHFNSLCVLTLWWINGNKLISIVWKITKCWLLAVFSLNTNRGRRSASPLIHTWLIESEVLPCLSYLVMIEGGRERPPLRCQFCLLLLSSDSHRVTLPFITTRRMHLGVIFPRHNIYIYIYIYNVPGDQSSISGRFIPKTPKMVLDSSFLNTHHYKVRFKGRD